MINENEVKVLAGIIKKTEKLTAEEKEYISVLLDGWILKKEYDQTKSDHAA